MLVVMVMEARYPFGKDWAEAARSGGADVVEIEVVRELDGERLAPGVARAGEHYRVQRTNLRPDRYLRPVADHIVGRRISRVIREIERTRHVDVIHTHFYREMGPILRMRTRPAHVHTEHSASFAALDLGDSAHYQPTESGLRVALEGSRQAECVIAVCQYLADQMGRFGIPGPIHVVPCPMDPAMTRRDPQPPATPPRIVTVGRLSPEKRVGLLLEALAIARETEPALELDVIGGGALDAELQAHAARLGLADAVTFHGAQPRDRLAEIAGPAAAFVTATLSEMFGTACAEALCLGLPVVAPDVGGLSEHMNGSNGVLVPDADARSLADAICATITTEYDRAAISRHAIARMSQERVGEQLAELYRDAVAAHSGTRRS